MSCRAAIAKLREDNAKLKEELLLENKFSVTPTSSNLSANIANLQDQSDVYTRKVWPVRSSNVLLWGYCECHMNAYYSATRTCSYIASVQASLLHSPDTHISKGCQDNLIPLCLMKLHTIPASAAFQGIMCKGCVKEPHGS